MDFVWGGSDDIKFNGYFLAFKLFLNENLIILYQVDVLDRQNQFSHW